MDIYLVGTIIDIQFEKKANGKPKGSCTITMSSIEECERAINIPDKTIREHELLIKLYNCGDQIQTSSSVLSLPTIQDEKQFCLYFNSPRGCKNGINCQYLHKLFTCKRCGLEGHVAKNCVASRDVNRIFVAQLPNTTTDKDLYEFFKDCGIIITNFTAYNRIYYRFSFYSLLNRIYYQHFPYPFVHY
jgi:RNA recognition motif-containing protein